MAAAAGIAIIGLVLLCVSSPYMPPSATSRTGSDRLSADRSPCSDASAESAMHEVMNDAGDVAGADATVAINAENACAQALPPGAERARHTDRIARLAMAGWVRSRRRDLLELGQSFTQNEIDAHDADPKTEADLEDLNESFTEKLALTK